MISTIAYHSIAPGRQQEAKGRVGGITQLAREGEGLVSRQVLYSQEDSSRLVTVTTWRSLEEFEAWDRWRRDHLPWGPNDPTPWDRPVEQELFDVASDVQAEGAEQGDPTVASIVHHWVLPERLEVARQRHQSVSELARGREGFVRRQVLYSRDDPLKLSVVVIWRTMEGYEVFDEARKGTLDPNDPPLYSNAGREFFTVAPDL